MVVTNPQAPIGWEALAITRNRMGTVAITLNRMGGPRNQGWFEGFTQN